MEASLNILGSPAERDAMIKNVLDQNNKAIDDIDGLLATINNTYCSWFNHLVTNMCSRFNCILYTSLKLLKNKKNLIATYYFTKWILEVKITLKLK